MSLKIRLARGGTKKRPYYRVVVAESRMPRDGRFVEKIGLYNPMLPKDSDQRVTIDVERAKHWLKLGPTPTGRRNSCLTKVGLTTVPERREQTKQHMPKKKAQERAGGGAAAGGETAPAAATTPAAPAQ